MLHDLICIGLGSLSTLGITLLVIRRRRPIIGDTLYLSVDPQDRALLAAGKVCNVRMSTIKDLADKSHGDVGLVVRVESKF